LTFSVSGATRSANPPPFTAILLAANGGVVGYQESFLVNLTGTPQSTPAFLGFDSDIPFSSIIPHAAILPGVTVARPSGHQSMQ
jgi:hypothetical protein